MKAGRLPGNFQQISRFFGTARLEVRERCVLAKRRGRGLVIVVSKLLEAPFNPWLELWKWAKSREPVRKTHIDDPDQIAALTNEI